MARIYKKPIAIPQGVTATVNGQQIDAKGPKGSLTYNVHELVTVKLEDNVLHVSANEKNNSQLIDNKFLSSILGTTRANLQNVITGVHECWQRKLTLIGVGYKAQIQGKKINLSLGFSHPVDYDIPEGITVEAPTPTELVISGVDKQLVGQVATNIRAIRSVEPYKGKGIRYSDERVILKEVKKK